MYNRIFSAQIFAFLLVIATVVVVANEDVPIAKSAGGISNMDLQGEEVQGLVEQAMAKIRSQYNGLEKLVTGRTITASKQAVSGILYRLKFLVTKMPLNQSLSSGNMLHTEAYYVIIWTMSWRNFQQIVFVPASAAIANGKTDDEQVFEELRQKLSH